MKNLMENEKQIRLGLIGFGVVNQAIYQNIKNISKPSTIIYSLENRYSQNFAETLKTDINIITINTNYISDKLNTELLLSKKNNFKKFGSKKSLKGLMKLIQSYYINDYSGTLIIKSTCNPKLLNKYMLKKFQINIFEDMNILFWPEFLNAVTAKEDFETETPLIGGDTKLILETIPKLNKIFNKIFNISCINTGTAQEVMEYKYFRNMLLMNHFAFINTIPHLFDTDIRKFDKYQNSYKYNFNNFKIASDGHIGVGGACLPKDLDNYIQSIYNIDNKKYIETTGNSTNKKEASLKHLENLSTYNKNLKMDN